MDLNFGVEVAAPYRNREYIGRGASAFPVGPRLDVHAVRFTQITVVKIKNERRAVLCLELRLHPTQSSSWGGEVVDGLSGIGGVVWMHMSACRMGKHNCDANEGWW